MSITVKGLASDSKTCTLHHIPCEIERTGDANVQEFFESTIGRSDDGELTASFRGRPLNGTKIEVPDGYRGLILTEKNRPFSDDEQRDFKVDGQFTEFTRWNLNLKTSRNDALAKAMVWMDVAKAIHVDSPNSKCKTESE